MDKKGVNLDYAAIPYVFMLIAIGLKAFKVIDVEWFWIFSPIWVSGIVLLVLIIAFLIFAVFRR